MNEPKSKTGHLSYFVFNSKMDEQKTIHTFMLSVTGVHFLSVLWHKTRLRLILLRK